MADKNKLAAVPDVETEEAAKPDAIDEAIKEATRPDLIPCTEQEWQIVEAHLANVRQQEQQAIAAQERFQGVLFSLAVEYKVDLASYRFDYSKRGFVKV